MNKRQISSDRIIRTFKVSSDRHEYVPGTKTKLVDDGEIYKIHIPDSRFEFHGGFKKKLLEIQSDDKNTIVQFYAVIEVYYVPPSYLVFEKDPVMLGTVNYSGNLVPGDTWNKPKWNTQIIVSCPFNEKNSDGLPAKVREVGPGALISSVVQSLFGTLDGIKMLDLEGYEIPDAGAGLSQIKITE